MQSDHDKWMTQAIELAVENVRSGRGGPFGAIVVRQDEVVATGVNQVTFTLDPTAHAEVAAIRKACQTLGTFQLADCTLYTSCEPCPMCLGAIYWARLQRFSYAFRRQDAAAAGFDDHHIYREIALPPDQRTIPGSLLRPSGSADPFQVWTDSIRKILY